MNQKQFNKPPALYRPAPFWCWNDKLDHDEMLRQQDELTDKGMGSYFLHTRVGLISKYLSEEWMQLVNNSAKKAQENGAYIWLYDEDKWPSGYAGGIVPAMNEAFRSRALIFVESGKEEPIDTVLMHVDYNGKQYSICKRVSPLGSLWFNKTSYVDLMNPKAVKAFLESTHEKYRESCGENFGKTILGIFTDEPCYLMQNHYPIPAAPWSDCLPDYFEEMCGYRIEEHLDSLFLNSGDYKKIRYDFYRCASQLLLESFTKQYYEWCQKNNMIFTGHFMAEDALSEQVKWVGSVMPHYEYMSWPGVDKLGRNLDQVVTLKQVTSVADQLNKERALCEVFGCVGQQVSFYHRKWIADWEAALGINFVNSHLSLYSMRGERKRDFPANLFYQQPWWNEEKSFSDYIGRLSYLAAEGNREVNILVIHPLGSAWSEFTPLDRENDYANISTQYHQPFEKLSKHLMANKLDYHYGDEVIMERHASVQDAKFVIGSCQYDTVIVPPCSVLASNTINLLKAFAEQAGDDRLIVMQGVIVPELADCAKTAAVDEVIGLLDKYYVDRLMVTDKMTGKNADDIYAHIRNTDTGRMVMLTNTNKDREIQTIVSAPNVKDIKILDLMNGECYAAPTYHEDGVLKIDVLFQPSGSVSLALDSTLRASKQESPVFFDSGIALATQKKMLNLNRAWQVDAMEENVLVLEDITLYLDEKKVLEDKPISLAWHQYFYQADDGTPFIAEYKFNVQQVPDGELTAVIEAAENLDSITINGFRVEPIKKSGDSNCFDENKNWKDVGFMKVPITGHVIAGQNIIRLEGKKMNNITGPGFHVAVEDAKDYRATEVEAIYIIGDFYVENLDNQAFFITKSNSVKFAENMTNHGYPFYAGELRYRASIACSETEKPVYLEITEVNCACASLTVNGQNVGTKLWYPFIYDVSDYIKQGENDIEIVISSTLFNVLGPNRYTGIQDLEFVGPSTFISHGKFTNKRELMPFGVGKAFLFTT